MQEITDEKSMYTPKKGPPMTDECIFLNYSYIISSGSDKTLLYYHMIVAIPCIHTH